MNNITIINICTAFTASPVWFDTCYPYIYTCFPACLPTCLPTSQSQFDCTFPDCSHLPTKFKLLYIQWITHSLPTQSIFQRNHGGCVTNTIKINKYVLLFFYIVSSSVSNQNNKKIVQSILPLPYNKYQHINWHRHINRWIQQYIPTNQQDLFSYTNTIQRFNININIDTKQPTNQTFFKTNFSFFLTNRHRMTNSIIRCGDTTISPQNFDFFFFENVVLFSISPNTTQN